MRRSVVVTGASAGVGRAVAQEFARHGWNVALLARGREGLEGAKRDVERLGGRALVLPTDVAQAAAVEAAADEAERAFGPIDIWVNAAMVTVYAPIDRMTADEFRRVTEVTYLGYVHGTMAALKRMKPRDSGMIVQVGSALAYRSIPLQSGYCAAKAAIRGFTDSLRSELIHDKSRVRVTMALLPAVNTPQFDWARNKMPQRPQPVPPIYQPEPIAREIYRAAMEAPRELWIGRMAIQSILGNMVAPSYLDHMLAEDAYKGQQSDEPAIPGRPDNLFEPVPRDAGSHGRFDKRARRDVASLTAEGARLLILGAALGMGVATVVAGGVARRLVR